MHLFEVTGDLNPVPEPDPSRARIAALNGSSKERARFVENLAINVEGLTDPIGLIERLMAKTGVVKAPGGIRVLGPGGSGKSFIAERLNRRHPARDSPTRRYVPVAFVKLFKNPVPSDVLRRLLSRMGQRLAKPRYTDAELLGLLLQALRACDTRIILVDEAHHMSLTTGKRNSDRAAGPVGELFKEVYDESGVPFGFLGKPLLGELFEADDQSDTRWPAEVELFNFTTEPVCRGVLRAFDDALPVPQRAGLGDDPLFPKVSQSCKGNFRRTKNFLLNAVIAAVGQGASCIDEGHLHVAHYETFGRKNNPFRLPKP